MDLNNYKTLNQTEAHENTSSKYALVPTKTMLDIFSDYGWLPAKVFETNARLVTTRGFQKHIVKLRQADQMNTPAVVGDLVGGIFRFVCANGAVAGESVQDYRVRHSGFALDKAENAVRNLIAELPKIEYAATQFKAITLDDSERKAYAEAALELVKDDEGKFAINPLSLISPRRWNDRDDKSLWSTFNVVQENAIKGGMRRIDENGRRTRTRAVRNIDKDLSINRALWTLTEKMAALKSAH